MNSSVAANFNKSSERCLTGTIYHLQTVTTDVLVASILSCSMDVAVILTAISGNVLVILAISLNRSLHHNAEFVLLALAVSDFFVSALLNPLMFAKKIGVITQRPSCATATVFQVVFSIVASASVVSEMLVSLDRTIAVMAPFWYEKWVTTTRLFAPPACVWFIMTLVSLSTLWILPVELAHLVFGGFLAVCILVTVVCYGLLVKVANHHENQVQAQQQQVPCSEEERKKKRERKALWTAIYINGAYFVGYLPTILAAIIITTANLSEQKLFLLRSWAGTLGSLVITANPIILCWRNSRVGRQMKKLLGFSDDNDEVQPHAQPHAPGNIIGPGEL